MVLTPTLTTPNFEASSPWRRASPSLPVTCSQSRVSTRSDSLHFHRVTEFETSIESLPLQSGGPPPLWRYSPPPSTSGPCFAFTHLTTDADTEKLRGRTAQHQRHLHSKKPGGISLQRPSLFDSAFWRGQGYRDQRSTQHQGYHGNRSASSNHSTAQSPSPGKPTKARVSASKALQVPG